MLSRFACLEFLERAPFPELPNDSGPESRNWRLLVHSSLSYPFILAHSSDAFKCVAEFCLSQREVVLDFIANAYRSMDLIEWSIHLGSLLSEAQKLVTPSHFAEIRAVAFVVQMTLLQGVAKTKFLSETSR